MIKKIKDFINRKIINQHIYSEIVFPKKENIHQHHIEITCNYPFAGTIISVPKENIENFEHCFDPAYSFLFYVRKNIFKKDLDFKLDLVAPVKLSKKELDRFWKESEEEIADLLDGAIDKD